MQMKWVLSVMALIGMAALSGAPAHAQANGTAGKTQTRAAASESQTDIGFSGYEAMNANSTGNGTAQTTTNNPGGMFELRHISRPLIGYEFTYSYNPETETFAPETGACGLHCQNPTTKLSSKVSEVTLDWVFSKQYGNLRPFAVGGLGFFITSPDNSTYGINTVVRPVYAAGGGVDYAFSQHLGVRVQFRDNFYKAPNLSTLFSPTGLFTHTAEPMGGIFYRF